MTLYARSDVMMTALSRSHGGCGQTHARPVVKGAPVKTWALSCEQCESFLRHDDQWSVTVSGIPETPDEVTVREDQEKRGKRDLENATGEAIVMMGDMAPAMKQIAEQSGMTTTMLAAMFQAMVENGLIKAPAAVAPAAPAEPVVLPDLNAMSVKELQIFAREREIKTTRGKEDQIQLILDHYAGHGA
jgi:hypothetical protein